LFNRVFGRFSARKFETPIKHRQKKLNFALLLFWPLTHPPTMGGPLAPPWGLGGPLALLLALGLLGIEIDGRLAFRRQPPRSKSDIFFIGIGRR
jgi:hypothetical protein